MLGKLMFALFLYFITKLFFYKDEEAHRDKEAQPAENAHLDLSSSHSNALFAVAERLEKLYQGSNVYVALQIPDPDSACRKNIDIVVVTNEEAMVISVKNVSGFVHIDKDNNWVCTDENNHKTKRLANPVAEAKGLVSILGEYLGRRGVALPEGYLSFKVICPNPNFGFIHSDSCAPEVITHDQWTQLKPEQRNSYFGWIKDAYLSGKKKTQESFLEKLNSALGTAPVSDRLELDGDKCILGEFLHFEGERHNLQEVRKIKRSKVSRLTVENTTFLWFASSTLRLAPRYYRVEGPSRSSDSEGGEVPVRRSSQWDKVTVSQSTEIVFQPQNSTKASKYKLSSVRSMTLSA